MRQNGILKQGMGFEARICGIRAGCLSHICQDAIAINQFTDAMGEKVFVGAVSDGCSGSVGSEHGAKFLVESFLEESERFGKSGFRNIQLLSNVALAITERMSHYTPKLMSSKIIRSHGIDICEEQTATLYGFISDKDRTLLLLSGDGYLSINDNHKLITQKNGDIYPEYLLRFPKTAWGSRLKDVYAFFELKTDQIRNIILATDGFGNPVPEEYPGLANNPAMFILHAHCNATEWRPYGDFPGANAFRGGDDTTALVLGVSSNTTACTLDATDVEKISKSVEALGNNQFFNDIRKMPSETIRHSARQVSATLDKNFVRDKDILEDVECFGLAFGDMDEYKRRRNTIFASRIFDSNPLAFLFGAPCKPQPPRSSSRATLPSGNRKLGDVIATRKSDMPQAKIAPTITVTAKVDQQPRQTKGHASKWRQFSDLCNIAGSRRTGIGFRQFGQVMYDLWHFINDCHLQGIRIGNLRPWDILYKINPAHTDDDGVKKPATYGFSLANPENSAQVEKGGKLIQNYSNLDVNFIHPEYFPKLSTDDQARLDQDWYAYSVLCYWFVTKHDPFGEGIVKAKPDADRVYRMKENLLSESPDIIIEAKKRIFIERALGRLSPDVFFFVNEFTKGKPIIQEPDFLINEFRNENVVTCNNEIFKGIKINHKVKCGFKQLDGYNICRYCGLEIKKLLATKL